jgi:hypothetical protein
MAILLPADCISFLNLQQFLPDYIQIFKEKNVNPFQQDASGDVSCSKTILQKKNYCPEGGSSFSI